MLLIDTVLFTIRQVRRMLQIVSCSLYIAVLVTAWIHYSVAARTEATEIVMGGDVLERFDSQMTKHNPAAVLFSMTTTLHIPGKEEFVRTALDSFLMHHPNHRSLVKRWLVINEFSNYQSSDRSNALQRIQEQYPFINTYQKEAHEQGQARSLNILLEELRIGNYSYWLHVEESWRTVRPFLGIAVQALDDHPYLHQLQLYHADYYLNHTHTRITEDIEVIALNSHVDLMGADPRAWRTFSYSWPSYSLRPSLTRACFLKDHADLVFDTDPDRFPVIFELDFAIKWELRGGSMCALVDKAIVRQEGHRSTYTLESSRNAP